MPESHATTATNTHATPAPRPAEPPPDTAGRSATRTVIVVLPDGTGTDWLGVVAVLAWHRHPAVIPHRAFPVRRPALTGWITRWSRRHLTDPTRRHGAVTIAAGGRISRLDLRGAADTARRTATDRWRTWHAHIARGTGNARCWESFLADHHRDPGKLPLQVVRARFEAQPRVLAMLAYNSYPAAPHHLDVDELAAYQAGEAVYAALAWQQALTGDALITPDGRWLQPASSSLADRLRYHADAVRIVHGLPRDRHLVAVRAAALP
jgi:hypothetical protein